jgi:nucleoside-diphosphate-sugar epimerase
MQKKILVTGANGFIGRSLCKYLAADGLVVVAAVRRRTGTIEETGNVRIVETGATFAAADWPNLLRGCDAVVHLAGRAHIMADQAHDPLAAYREVNVEMTRVLAEAAAAAGVKRFVYLSSIKVSGEKSAGEPLREDRQPRLTDPYSVSKFEAENSLRQICEGTAMEYVIIRPPLVYGPGVKANFARLFRLAGKKIPLPLAAIANARGMIGIDNLVNFISCCLNHPNAGGEIFNVSDDEDISTPDLLGRIGVALGIPARLFPLPLPFLKLVFLGLGQKKAFARLTESLPVDISKAKERLGWRPPSTMAQELARTVQWYADRKNR